MVKAQILDTPLDHMNIETNVSRILYLSECVEKSEFEGMCSGSEVLKGCIKDSGVCVNVS